MNFIYSILNKINGKIYVGQTIQGFQRFKKHKYELNHGKHPNKHFQSAWDKYGEDAFEFNVLEHCSKEDLNDNEDWWINYFDSTNPQKGYNLRSGGDSNFIVSDETKKKLSDINRGENHWNFGKKTSVETRRKISESMKQIENPMKREEIRKKFAEDSCYSRNNTGYYRVSKHTKSDCKQGFYWSYQWREDGKRRSINSVDLDKLKDKVTSQGLSWFKLPNDGGTVPNG